MEDEDIAANTHSLSSRYGQKVTPVHFIPVRYGVQERLSDLFLFKILNQI